jgi:hypothetical protein
MPALPAALRAEVPSADDIAEDIDVELLGPPDDSVIALE